VTYDDRYWDEAGTLSRVARAGSRESRSVLLVDAPLWALVARVIETQRHESFMGPPWIEMESGFVFGPDQIKALIAAPDRWTGPRPIRVPP
jgi:hypothetical protein